MIREENIPDKEEGFTLRVYYRCCVLRLWGNDLRGAAKVSQCAPVGINLTRKRSFEG